MYVVVVVGGGGCDYTMSSLSAIRNFFGRTKYDFCI